MYKYESVPFINRDSEIISIANYITDDYDSDVILLSGEGGVGKTRFLNQVINMLVDDLHNKNYKAITTGIMDFDDTSLYAFDNIKSLIIDILGEDNFTRYLERLLDLRKMEEAGIRFKTLEEELSRVNDIFIEEFNKVSQDKNIVLVFDTLDKFPIEKIENKIWFLDKMSNYTLILTARNTKPLYDLLKSKSLSYQFRIHHIHLNPLMMDARELYLEKKMEMLNITLRKDVMNNLSILSQGRPILIDLALEWVAQDKPLDWVIHTDLSNFSQLSSHEKEYMLSDFEFHLVEHIIQLDTRLDRLILAMSHVYPLSLQMIEELLKIDTAAAKDLFSYASRRSYIKTLPNNRLSLHDEMRRIISTHIWPKIDEWSDRQKRNSSISVNFFKKEIEAIDNELLSTNNIQDFKELIKRENLARGKDLAILQWVKHALFTDINLGFEVYKNQIDKARAAYKHDLVSRIHDIASSFVSQMSTEQQFSFKIIEARILSRMGRFDDAKESLINLLHNATKERLKAVLYSTIAECEIHQGNINKGVEYHLQSFQILRDLNHEKSLTRQADHLGFAYLLLGDHQKAIDYYLIGLNIALKENNSDPLTIAGISNDLAYVLNLESRYDEAENACKQSIEIWTNFNLQIRIGQGEITLGAIYRSQGRYSLSVDTLRRAIARINENPDVELLIRGYFHLGWTYWFKGKEEKNIEELKTAKNHLEKSVNLARENFILSELTSALHQLASVCWDLGEREVARTLNTEAYNLSIETFNTRYAIDCLVAMAEFDLDEKIYSNMDHYSDILTKEYQNKGYNYSLFYGRMHRIRGDVYYLSNDFELAFQEYSKGIPMIKQHGGYGFYSIENELMALSDKINALPVSIAKKYITYLKEVWSQEAPSELYSSLLTWCNRQLISSNIRHG